MTNKTFTASLLAGVLVTSGATAGEREDLLKLRNTTINLIEMLVQEGIFSREKAEQLIRQAEQQADEQLAAEERETAEPDPKVVRVPYVPEFVRDEIRDEVRAELREDVVNDVMAQAKNERWGVPEALPSWVNRIKFKGDVRLRGEAQLFASDNVEDVYIDFNEVNDAGGVTAAGEDAFINTTEDRYRGRVRARVGMDAKVNNSVKAGLRMTTGNTDNPVSTNQTLGDYNNRYELVLDRAYLNYKGVNLDAYEWLDLSGGRIANPWFHTDLVWDSDLGFEGAAATYKTSLVGSDNLYDLDDTARTLFFTVGAFSLQEVELSSKDKWLFGAQLGTDWKFENQSRFKVALAYYDYYNIRGRQNPLDSQKYDYTAPEFLQKGNTLMRISNDTGENPNDPRRVGLASDFDIVNLTARYDIAAFAPTHLSLFADYAVNIGFDEDEVERRTGFDVSERNEAYQFGLKVGWPKVRKRRDWQVFGAWKHLERDAVLDAFTDSDFHLGGTDAEGWILGGMYGIADNTWLTARWMSTDEIDGPPLGVDTLQLDLNARF